MTSRCIICLEDASVKHTFPCACSEFFHEPCLQNWYRETGSYTCPVCRIPFRQYRIQEPERVVTYNPAYTPPQSYVPPQNYTTIPISPTPHPSYPVAIQTVIPIGRGTRIMQFVCVAGMTTGLCVVFYVAMRDNW
jgi:hypothetical protein